MEHGVLSDPAQTDIPAMRIHRITDFDGADILAVHIGGVRVAGAIEHGNDAVGFTWLNRDRNRFKAPPLAVAPGTHIKLATINIEVEAVDRAAFLIDDLTAVHVVACSDREREGAFRLACQVECAVIRDIKVIIDAIKLQTRPSKRTIIGQFRALIRIRLLNRIAFVGQVSNRPDALVFRNAIRLRSVDAQHAIFWNARCDQADLTRIWINRERPAITIDQAECVGVTCVWVGDTDSADDAIRRVFIDRVIINIKIDRRLVQIDDVDSECLAGRQTAAIGCGHGDINRARRFIIKRHTICEPQLAIHDLEAIVRNRVRDRVTHVRISDRQGSDHLILCILVDACRDEYVIDARVREDLQPWCSDIAQEVPANIALR